MKHLPIHMRNIVLFIIVAIVIVAGVAAYMMSQSTDYTRPETARALPYEVRDTLNRVDREVATRMNTVEDSSSFAQKFSDVIVGRLSRVTGSMTGQVSAPGQTTEKLAAATALQGAGASIVALLDQYETFSQTTTDVELLAQLRSLLEGSVGLFQYSYSFYLMGDYESAQDLATEATTVTQYGQALIANMQTQTNNVQPPTTTTTIPTSTPENASASNPVSTSSTPTTSTTPDAPTTASTPTTEQVTLPDLRFTKQNQQNGQAPAWTGGIVAGDPSVLKIGNTFYMYHTAFGYDESGEERTPIAVARSQDGKNWDTISGEVYQGTNIKVDTIALQDVPGTWEEVLETAYVHQIGSRYFMYYTGHSKASAQNSLIPYYQIGVATSDDGVNWSKQSLEPIIKANSPNDFDAAVSPSVVTHNGTHYMIYTGFCLENCSGEIQGFGLTGATSPDGINWTKTGSNILPGSQIPWGISEPFEAELEKGTDGKFYLFFSMDINETSSSLGVARSDNPFGPWEVYPEPILEANQAWEKTGGLIAPTVMIEDDVVRIWYMGGDIDDFAEGFSVGYAEAAFPFAWKE